MLKMSPAPQLRYPYEEFADHIKAMPMVRRWEYTSRFGHLGSSQTSQANNARVVDYFSDCYPDQQEAIQKAEVFLLIYDYIGHHAALFSRKGLLEESGKSLFSVEPGLLRAVHYIFTTTARPRNVPLKKVLNLAKAFKEIVPAV